MLRFDYRESCKLRQKDAKVTREIFLGGRFQVLVAHPASCEPGVEWYDLIWSDRAIGITKAFVPQLMPLQQPPPVLRHPRQLVEDFIAGSFRPLDNGSQTQADKKLSNPEVSS